MSSEHNTLLYARRRAVDIKCQSLYLTHISGASKWSHLTTCRTLIDLQLFGTRDYSWYVWLQLFDLMTAIDSQVWEYPHRGISWLNRLPDLAQAHYTVGLVLIIYDSWQGIRVITERLCSKGREVIPLYTGIITLPTRADLAFLERGVQLLKRGRNKLGGLGACPRKYFRNFDLGGGGGGDAHHDFFIANGAFWINLDHQLRAECLPIFSYIVYSSPATYFILVIVNVMDCGCIDADTRRGPMKKGGPETPDPMDPPPLDPPLTNYIAIDSQFYDTPKLLHIDSRSLSPGWYRGLRTVSGAAFIEGVCSEI